MLILQFTFLSRSFLQGEGYTFFFLVVVKIIKIRFYVTSLYGSETFLQIIITELIAFSYAISESKTFRKFKWKSRQVYMYTT